MKIRMTTNEIGYLYPQSQTKLRTKRATAMLHHRFPNFPAFFPQLSCKAELVLEAEFTSRGQETASALWYGKGNLFARGRHCSLSQGISKQLIKVLTFRRKMPIIMTARSKVINLWYVYNRGYAKTSYINQNETQEPLEPWTRSDPRTHEDSSPNWGAGMPETSSVISLTVQNHINSW
jgi:hypothetical protein